MALLQLKIFRNSALTILSRLLHYIHIQGFMSEALHHSVFTVHSRTILSASQKEVIILVDSIDSTMNLKVSTFFINSFHVSVIYHIF